MGRLTLIAGLLATVFVLPLGAEEAPSAESLGVGEYFTGAEVKSFKGRRIVLEYDLSDPSCLEDFVEGNPFLIPPKDGFECLNGALEGKGVAALVHKGVFEADIVVLATLTPKTPRDLGILLVQPGLTDQFLLFALWDNFFCKKDRQPVNQHMITVVGADAKDGEAGASDFRYLKRATKPEIEKDRPLEVVVKKAGERNHFEFGGTKLVGGDRYGNFPAVQPALYVLHSSMTVTSLRISGKLSEAWLREKGIRFDPDEKDSGSPPKIEKPAADSPSRPGGGGPGRGPRGWGGQSEALGHIATLRDTGRTEKERRDAAAALDKKNVKVEEFRELVDCLYSDDLLTRTLAITVLKNVTRKTLGYNPKAPESDRKKAARSWFKYYMDNRERLR